MNPGLFARHRALWLLTCVALAAAWAPPAAGQSKGTKSRADTTRRASVDSVGGLGHVTRLVIPTSDSVNIWRLRQLIGLASANGFLLRSPSSVHRESGLGLLLPSLTIVSNSGLPYGENDGSLWAGRGTGARGIVGAWLSAGPLKIIVAPEFAYSRNTGFTYNQLYTPPLLSGRNAWSSPWNGVPYSIDLPPRFGDAPFRRVTPGQSSVVLGLASVVEVGASTENEWWGPGIRSALLLSDNAEGFRHLFIRTARPISTPLGDFEARWLVGGLTESAFFDNQVDNDLRSIAAIAATWRLRWQPGLTLGAARSVYGPTTGYSKAGTRWFDVFRKTDHPNALADTDPTLTPGMDQLISFFGRWVFPESGFETYFEWARTELPWSLRDFMLAPQHTQGYTLGGQWTRPARQGRLVLGGELTSLEQSPTFRQRPIGSWYTSRAVVQGYTNRGQVVGAAVGPGSNALQLALDYYAPQWQIGLIGKWTRFNDDARSRLPYPFNLQCTHDVLLAPGIRGSYTASWARISMEALAANRINAFFQNNNTCHEGAPTRINVRNKALTLTIAPLRW